MRADAPAPTLSATAILRVETTRSMEFVDLTDRLATFVAGSPVRDGVLVVQTRHTTTGLLVNEAEPLLLDDLAARLSCWAPLDLPYGHDDLTRRTLNLIGPRERRNGHAHCRAALLRTSEMVIVAEGRLALGRWQRVLFAEFDGPQRRELVAWVSGA